MHYHFRIHKEKKMYWAESLEKGLGVTSQGKSLGELSLNIAEALDLALDEPADSQWLPPLPDASFHGKNILEVSVDPKIAMATMVRMTRMRLGMTQREVAEKMGIKTLSAYQRLESSKTANPEWITLVKHKQVMPDFSLDMVAA